jgi:hypothetical protein
MFNMKPKSLIYGARYDRMMDPKDSQQPSALQSNAILLSVNCGPSNS